MMLLTRRACHSNGNDRLDKVQVEIPEFYPAFFVFCVVCKTGAPISLQDGLVTVSFLVIAAIINRLGLIASAGVGVAERVCGFIMLVPSAFSQSLSAFVAQNIGAEKYDRAKKAR